MRNKAKILVIILSVLILIIAICFVYLIFKYQKLKEAKTDFRIEFTHTDKVNPIKAGKFEPTSKMNITNHGQTLDMSFDLYTPNDEITYTATIKNIGDIKGKIINVIASPDYLNDDNLYKLIYPIKINVSSVIGTELAPGEETELKITVSYPKIKGKINPVNVPYQLTIIPITA
ncbi:MAG: hypothetical protein IJI43_01575 [Bacilli bacterium]|nr:hypothetical protein [Bacilli bacterium]